MDQESRGKTRVLDVGGKAKLARPIVRLSVAGGASVESTETLRIGKDPICDLVLEDAAVSGVHCEVRPSEHGPRLRDLNSTNGTYVAGLRVHDIHLGDTADIVIGSTKVKLEVQPDADLVDLSRSTNFGGLLGHAAAMRAAFAMLEGAAKTEATVLITGETGTGKELAARALHDRSPRAGAPFIILDCGAAQGSLLEAHLFGHARGAFTGAQEAREGVFEAASSGTLVLDEIGELPLDLQPKLLRVLESRTVTRLGETRARSVDVRFIASTHRSLANEVRAGRFREDLFYRLSVIAVTLPPLRDRKEELPRLLASFLAKLSPNSPPPALPAPVRSLLESHDWPGNVRELRNFAERFLALPQLSAEALLGAAPGSLSAQRTSHVQSATSTNLEVSFHDAKRDHGEEFERQYFVALLSRYGDNISEAARVAGLSRQTCYRMMAKHGLKHGE